MGAAPVARFAFVMEQTLGHVAHTRNLEQALAGADWIEGSVIKLPFEATHPLGRLPGLRNWSLRASLMARSALARRLRERPLDAAFIHTQVPALLSVGIMHAVPTVVSLDATPKNFDDVGEAYGHARAGALVETVKAAVVRRALLAARALVTWSRLAADSLTGDYGIPAGRVHVIPPGVNVEHFGPPEIRRVDSSLRVLFVGGDLERKGGVDLLEAARGLPDIEVDIVTGSEVKPPAGVHCRVHRGLQPADHALLDLYRRAHVFAMPSRGDCMPQALAEAAAAGLPLVSTPVGAIPEILHDGRNGLLVPVRSPSDLRDALRHLAANPDLRQSMGRESLALARKEHDAMVNHRRIFDLMATSAGIGAHRRAAVEAG